MPVILDDVSVNFDPPGLRAAIDLLGEVAGRRQLLLFTCHPEVAQQVTGAGLVGSDAVISLP